MWSSFALPAFALLASVARPVAAQTQSDCNPMNGTDCDPNPAFGTEYTFYFNETPPESAWEVWPGKADFTEEHGAELTINEQGDSPTLRSKFYIFYGRTEMSLRVAPGRGVVSSFMLLSDTLDEIDWEFLGDNGTHALTNYYGQGKEQITEGEDHVVPDGDIEDNYHNYTVIWTEEQIEWWINDEHARTLKKEDALDGGDQYPQTPMKIFIGIWAGGDPRLPEGTREWAGGDTDYDAGPYSMYCKSIHVEDFSSGKEYVYTDDSGKSESIEIVDEGKNSTVAEELNKPPKKSVGEKFDELPTGAKIGVYAAGGAVGAALIGALLWYIIRQRMRGQREAAAAAKRSEADRLENDTFYKGGMHQNASSTDPSGPGGANEYYSSRDMAKEGYYEENYEVPVSSASPLHGGSRGGGSAPSGWDDGAAFGAASGAQGNHAPSHVAVASPTSPSFHMPMRSPSPRVPQSPASPGPQTFGDMDLGSHQKKR